MYLLYPKNCQISLATKRSITTLSTTKNRNKELSGQTKEVNTKLKSSQGIDIEKSVCNLETSIDQREWISSFLKWINTVKRNGYRLQSVPTNDSFLYLNNIWAWLLNSPWAYFKRKRYYGFTLDLTTSLKSVKRRTVFNYFTYFRLIVRGAQNTKIAL